MITISLPGDLTNVSAINNHWLLRYSQKDFDDQFEPGLHGGVFKVSQDKTRLYELECLANRRCSRAESEQLRSSHPVLPF